MSAEKLEGLAVVLGVHCFICWFFAKITVFLRLLRLLLLLRASFVKLTIHKALNPKSNLIST